jgi:hypothetical protein
MHLASLPLLDDESVDYEPTKNGGTAGAAGFQIVVL